MEINENFTKTFAVETFVTHFPLLLFNKTFIAVLSTSLHYLSDND